MCSVNDCDYDPLLIVENNKVEQLENTKCKKCLENEAQILLRGKDAYCQACFLVSATHKFRAALGKSKIVRPNDHVLVAHSGKAGSTALLHLIRAGMHESVHKRLVFKTTVLYIDENLLYGNQLEDRTNLITKISDQIENLGFQGHWTTLSQIFNPDPQLEPLGSTNLRTEFDDNLLHCFNSLSDATSKEDLLTKLRQRLIVSAAKKLGCSKVFLGDDMTSLSVKILENISLGRAAHLSLDVSFADTRYPDLLLLRPMKDFSKKELDYYLNSFDLEIVQEDLRMKGSSIRKATEKFIKDLDADSNSTVSTVFRIGEKLSSNPGKKEQEENCILCEAQLDTKTDEREISTIESTQFSKLVSEKGMDFEKKEKETNGGCASACKGGCEKKKKEADEKMMMKFLCYGCRLIAKNFKSTKDVPDFLYNKILEKVSLESMRSEIEEFLL